MHVARITSFILVFSGLALAQVPLTCTADSGIPPTVRSSGKTELMGDLTLICTGGTPTAVGAPVPVFSLKIQAKSAVLQFDATGPKSVMVAPVNITSRQFTAEGASEAILLIDEPHSVTNPNVPLLVCGDTTAPLSAGDCVVLGTGTGSGTYDGTRGRPNVFQAKQTAQDTLQWSGVPIDPPAAGQTRVLRITNVRMNASQALTPLVPYFPAGLVVYPILNTASGAKVQVTTSGSYGPGFAGDAEPIAFIYGYGDLTATTSGGRGITILTQCQSNNSGLLSSPGTATYTVSVTAKEGFQDSFKRKNWSLTFTNNAYPTTYPIGGDQNQNITGAVYNTESGFVNMGPQRDPVPNPPDQLVYNPPNRGPHGRVPIRGWAD